MTDIRINNPVQSGFAMVPDVLWRWPGLSFKAKGFMAYLLSFRHGVCPPVAAMEQDTGLGRDARKAVMRELQSAGLARWIIQRGAGQRVVAKFLEVTTLPLLAAVVAEAKSADSHAPENTSHGEKRHAPEKPSDGKPVAPRRLSSRVAPAVQAILKRKEKEKEAVALSSASCSLSHPHLPSPLHGQAVLSAQGDAAAAMLRRIAFAKSMGLRPLNPAAGDFSDGAKVLVNGDLSHAAR